MQIRATDELLNREAISFILTEDVDLINKIRFEEIIFENITKFNELNILAGIQNLKKKDCLTVFRMIRFPTVKRIFDAVYKKGCTIENYEQERIIKLYSNKLYLLKRKNIASDRLFKTLPQERVVKGLPVFSLINDAIQINSSFRSDDDSILICLIHIHFKYIKNNVVKLVSNNAVDFKYNSKERDLCINNFVKNNHFSYIDYKSLRVRGIDLYECYLKGLPFNFNKIKNKGISNEFYFLKLKNIKNNNKIYSLKKNDLFLKNNEFFMHGFFGDQNIFGRDVSKYVPYKCYKVVKNV